MKKAAFSNRWFAFRCEDPFQIRCSVIRAIIVVVEMAFDEPVRPVCHGLVDGRGPPWVTQGPEGWGSLGKATVEAVRLKEIDEFARVFDEAWLDMITTHTG